MKHQIAMLKASLENVSHSNSYRIYYEDTDSGGVVYYANYLKFFERGRTEFLRTKNILQSDLAKNFGVIFVVRNCFIKYLKPAKLDDLVVVETFIEKIQKASMQIKQQMIKDEQILCHLNVEIACVDAISFKPKKIPQTIKLI